jgi:hypothetical protein
MLVKLAMLSTKVSMSPLKFTSMQVHIFDAVHGCKLCWWDDPVVVHDSFFAYLLFASVISIHSGAFFFCRVKRVRPVHMSEKISVMLKWTAEQMQGVVETLMVLCVDVDIDFIYRVVYHLTLCERKS